MEIQKTQKEEPRGEDLIKTQISQMSFRKKERQ